jgi:hypothetical protein
MSAILTKRKADEEVVIWWGEEKCTKCANKAYYKAGDTLLCGVHSRNLKRVELTKNPNAKDRAETIRFERYRQVLLTAKANREAGRKGTLTVCKLRMMKEADHKDGVLNVFPNNKHQNRTDGFGCASLSPMRLGPVRHLQPGVPEARTIENYHQFNKVFPPDLVDPSNHLSLVSPAFFTMRDAAYRDPIPHRHKYPKEGGFGGNKNAPLYSLHVKLDGTVQRYTYLQSRFFYCHQYELLAKQTADFAALRRKLDEGTNLQIVGYDGYPVTKSLWEHYNDTERPFGHELVLYSLLAVENPVDYPWNRFYRENHALY